MNQQSALQLCRAAAVKSQAPPAKDQDSVAQLQPRPALANNVTELIGVPLLHSPRV